MVLGLAAEKLSSMSRTFATAWRSAMKLPDGLTNRDKQWRLTFLAERQTCSNKMNERSAFEMFEKMQRHGRIHSHCIYTDFPMESHNVI